MIVSHKHRYIFIKPKKIAGTSIEVALAKTLGKTDIWPPLTEYAKEHDKDKYKIKSQNYTGFYDHEPPDRIRKKLGNEIWNSYFKFTAVRNPWDLVVSSYWWELNKKVSIKDYLRVINFKALFDYSKAVKKILRPKSFEEYVVNLPQVYINTSFYFEKNGKPIEDYYIRYESLEKDFQRVCKKLKVKPSKLLSLKSKTRKDKKHYSQYYTKKTKDIIAKLFKKEIKFFNYRFEDLTRRA